MYFVHIAVSVGLLDSLMTDEDVDYNHVIILKLTWGFAPTIPRDRWALPDALPTAHCIDLEGNMVCS